MTNFIDISIDLREFEDDMKKNIQYVPKAIAAIIRKVAFEVQVGAKAELYPGHGKDTGRLKRSISIIFPTKLSAEVSPHTEYADYIEEMYHYMAIGATKGLKKSKSITESVVNHFFGGG